MSAAGIGKTDRRTGLGRIEAAADAVRLSLREAAKRVEALGLPRPALDGKSLRPLATYLVVPETRGGKLDERFWFGALAVEMAHEASLLHDDILDEAPERRGRPTLVASAGVGAALVRGDHLLTSAYRVAALAGSPSFLDTFITSVERTVAGEIAQEGSQGLLLSEEEYRTIIIGKSGELFRSAFALVPSLLGLGSLGEVGELGARLGCLYQMVDDFLDYCPSADRGKAPLQDYRQRKWTWPLGLIGARGFEASEEELLDRLFRRPADGGLSPMEEGVRRVEEGVDRLLHGLTLEGLETDLLGSLLYGWIRQLRSAAEREGAPRLPAPVVPRSSLFHSGAPSAADRGPASTPTALPHREELAAAASALDGADRRLAYFGRHARSFRFASRLFPAEALERVAGVYAFCRFTDDLVDEAGQEDPGAVEERLGTWMQLTQEAYEGRKTGVPLLDEVIGGTGRDGVPYHYVRDLVEGVRMDLAPRRYRTLEELREYSYRVASVVGGWLTELFGVRDPWVLERAFALGHAMQLTNILRDVGEDLQRGRLYLPEDRMDRHGVDRPLLEAMAREGAPLFPGYLALLEELMTEADADYERAVQALPVLPAFFRWPVGVAARVYQGIHDEIRRNGYDNLTRRAGTSASRKIWLGLLALLSLGRSGGRGALHAPHIWVPASGLPGEEQREVAA